MKSALLFTLLAAAALAPQNAPVTFTENIAPIIYENCVTCHRPGEAAPFSLISYDDAKRRGALIATVTKSRYMPPWHAAHGFGDFEGERRLTDAQIAMIDQWVKQGMAEGNPSKMPNLPQFTEGWHLGKPDLVIEMPASFDVPASGPDVFRNFAIPLNLTEDKWVRAIEFRPGARKAAHHALFAYIAAGSASRLDGADGRPGFGGMGTTGTNPAQANSGGGLGGWAVGATPLFLPEGLAASLPKNSDFLLQMHFHPIGKAETEKAVLGIYFAPKAPERKLMGIGLPGVFGIGAHIDIPAGEKNFMVQDSFTVPVDVKAYSAAAHAHYLAKEMKMTATLPDGSTKPLIWIQDWDFNWQEPYNYKEPFVLPKGTKIDAVLRYDNSLDNPRNPSNPPKRVQWGEESFDEMGVVGIIATALRKEDEAELQKALNAQSTAAIAKAGADGTLARFLSNGALRRPAGNATPRTQITLFDRQGKSVGAVGEPAVFSQAAFSPDGKRIAVIKNDQGVTDVWVYDVATGKGTRVTSDPVANTSPVWSPDGKQLVYVSVFSGENYSAIYRKAADGSGTEELIYKHAPGTAVVVTDWSKDVLCFWAGNIMYALPLNADRKPIPLTDAKAGVRGGRFSPDGRFIAYSSNESGRYEAYVAAFDPRAGISNPVKVSKDSKDAALGGIFWREDGKELFFMNLSGLVTTGVSAVDIQTSPEIRAGEPRSVFRPQGVNSPAQLSNIATPDAQRFVFLPAAR